MNVLLHPFLNDIPFTDKIRFGIMFTAMNMYSPPMHSLWNQMSSVEWIMIPCNTM